MGFSTNFRDKEKAGTSSLERVTGKNFIISNLFHRSKQKLHFGFPAQKDN
jgi:hypothetical protein